MCRSPVIRAAFFWRGAASGQTWVGRRRNTTWRELFRFVRRLKRKVTAVEADDNKGEGLSNVGNQGLYGTVIPRGGGQGGVGQWTLYPEGGGRCM